MLIDKSYFLELAATSPDSIRRRVPCSYNTTEGNYSISLWGDEYCIDPKEMTTYCKASPNKPSHEYFPLFIIYYLLKMQSFTPNNEWISENDIPGGSTFFRGPHLIPTSDISGEFGNEIDIFRNKCKKLGGTPLDMADASFSFEIAPQLYVAVLYWVGDEDFPAEAKILYDSTISDLLPLDIIFALAVEVCTRIGSSHISGTLN